MLNFFPHNSGWSDTVAIAPTLGGELSEIAEVCQALKPLEQQYDIHATQEWFEAWTRMAERLERLGQQDEREGHGLSASRKYLRAVAYRLIADRLYPPSPKKLRAYQQMLAIFRTAIMLSGRPVQFVRVPYEGTTLPGLFLPAQGVTGRASAVVRFTGGDQIKEAVYLCHASDLQARGVSMLIVDQPGTGEALRLQSLTFRYDSEIPAGACVDYLLMRPEVDPDRIGMIDWSLGGYFAPRAVAFEKRFACCVAWGGIWNWAEVLQTQMQHAPALPEGISTQDYIQQFEWILCWPMGVAHLTEYMEKAQQFTLEGVADKITCPLLVLHGENDGIPVWTAERTYDAAVKHSRSKLKIFSFDEGGVEHCQVDNVTLATDYIHDWLIDVLCSTNGKEDRK